jgi:hypothetical protein
MTGFGEDGRDSGYIKLRSPWQVVWLSISRPCTMELVKTEHFCPSWIQPTVFLWTHISVLCLLTLYVTQQGCTNWRDCLTIYSLAIISRTTSFNIKKNNLHGASLALKFSLCGLLLWTPFWDWLCITEVEGVFCAVRTEFLCETDTLRLKRVNIKCNKRIARNTEFEIIGQ